ncbi:uncharacterized protein L3040_005365 [Drepanopeziza brunnea f. sp. 'multigermtubi']|uniref:uncharacterized protein n=1 Tax=Drepanopeziza brunnea f. sp. 'multigermtubi' TaxID=698441 RepID=UPI0023A34E0E|nr:hypothetical protein L3040_005365 [Drepanopeziza brunnea f. sp. 'multigermtubi']
MQHMVGDYGSALQAAISIGDTGLVKRLVNHGADVNANPGQYGTALQATCYGRDAGLAKTLLNISADSNAAGGGYGSAIQAAAASTDKQVGCMAALYKQRLPAPEQQRSISWKPIVKLFLERGADPNAIVGANRIMEAPYGNTLYVACGRGKLSIVTALLDRGADLNAQQLWAAKENGSGGNKRCISLEQRRTADQEKKSISKYFEQQNIASPIASQPSAITRFAT